MKKYYFTWILAERVSDGIINVVSLCGKHKSFIISKNNLFKIACRLVKKNYTAYSIINNSLLLKPQNES